MSRPAAVDVNGESLDAGQALRALVAREGLGALQRLARARLIARLAAERGVEVSDEQVQSAVDAWRYARHLERAGDTHAWLSANGMSMGDLAASLRMQLLEEALARRVTGGRIRPFFVRHSLSFDRAVVSRVLRRDRTSAEEIAAQVREEGASFHGLARAYSEDASTRPAGGYVGEVRRRDLPEGIAPLVFAADPGGLVGPARLGKGFALYLVEAIRPATLDERTEAEIRARLFDEWLAGRARSARITFPMFEPAARGAAPPPGVRGDRAEGIGA